MASYGGQAADGLRAKKLKKVSINIIPVLRSRNRNLPKVGTGTVKNSCGFANVYRIWHRYSLVLVGAVNSEIAVIVTS